VTTCAYLKNEELLMIKVNTSAFEEILYFSIVAGLMVYRVHTQITLVCTAGDNKIRVGDDFKQIWARLMKVSKRGKTNEKSRKLTKSIT
jgi:hypothetical protein